MADLDANYAKLSRGEPPDTLTAAERDLLLGRAAQKILVTDADARAAAVKVAGTLGGRDGLAVVARFVQDPLLAIRREVVAFACAQQADGLPVIREAAADADVQMSVEALRRLDTAVDKAATARVRNLLGSPAAPVRCAAVDLLGNTVGLVMRRQIEVLLTDADATVRRSAVRAIARIDGKVPRRTPATWWTPEALIAEPLGEAFPDPRPGQTPVPAPLAGEIREAKSTDEIRRAQTLPPMDSPLPRDVPRANLDPEPILREVSKATPEGIGAAAEPLRAIGEPIVAGMIRSTRDGAVLIGACRAAAALGWGGWSGTHLKKMLGERDPLVRAAALQALGVLARSPALVPPVAAMLGDSDPTVRISAVRALGAIGGAIGQGGLVRQRLAVLANDPDATVKSARDEVLGALP